MCVCRCARDLRPCPKRRQLCWCERRGRLASCSWPAGAERRRERAREAESEGVDRERVMIRSSPARCAVEGHLEASGMRSEQVGARLVRALSRRIVI